MTQQHAERSGDPVAIRSLDQLAGDYLSLLEQIEDLQHQLGTVKQQIIGQIGPDGVGSHTTPTGVKVAVTAPPRRFNADRAWTMLTEEQRAVCLSPDSAKVKKQLAGVLVDECMEPGVGSPRVTVR